MNHSKQFLLPLFPDMDADELEMRLDGVIPSSPVFIGRVLASDWFKGLTESQRAAYVVGWHHHAAPGSNQHAIRLSEKSTRFAAEQAQLAIAGAAA